MTKKLTEMNEKIEQAVTEGYKGIETGVTSGFGKMVETVTNGYEKVENAFVGTLFTKEGETVEEAKLRMKNNAQSHSSNGK